MRSKKQIKLNEIKYYWIRIGRIEGRIQELAMHGIDYSKEMQKRKSLLTNVNRMEKNITK